MPELDDLVGLTEWHRLRQNRVRAETVTGAVALMDRLDPEDVEGSARRWVNDTERFVRGKRGESAQLSLAYMTEVKDRRVGSRDVPWRTSPLNTSKMQTSLMLTGPAVLRRLSAQGVPLGRAMNTATTAASGAASRHALQGGREGLLQTVDQDSRARGWQRITSGDPCAFCAMLASRGAVFKSGETALGSRVGPTGEFQVHDHCNCTAEPVYGDTPLRNDQAEQYAKVWSESVGGLPPGASPAAQRNAFRRAFERGNFGTPRSAGVRPSRQVQGAPSPVRQLDPSQVPARIDAHRRWAESSGWSVRTEGRRMVGAKPDGSSIVWELTDRGTWRIAG